MLEIKCAMHASEPPPRRLKRLEPAVQLAVDHTSAFLARFDTADGAPAGRVKAEQERAYVQCHFHRARALSKLESPRYLAPSAPWTSDFTTSKGHAIAHPAVAHRPPLMKPPSSGTAMSSGANPARCGGDATVNRGAGAERAGAEHRVRYARVRRVLAQAATRLAGVPV